MRKCSQISILTNPKNQGKDFYIKNPYTNSYVSVLDDNIVYEFIKDRSLVMKEALVRLGAKEIKLEDNISDKVVDLVLSTNKKKNKYNVSVNSNGEIVVKTC